MSTCERVRARLEQALEGELSALEAARDAGHREACSGCAGELRARLALRAALCALPGPGPQAYAQARAGLARVLDSRREPRRPARELPPWLAPAGAAAAALVGLLTLGLFAPELPASLSLPGSPRASESGLWSPEWHTLPSMDLGLNAVEWRR